MMAIDREAYKTIEETALVISILYLRRLLADFNVSGFTAVTLMSNLASTVMPFSAQRRTKDAGKRQQRDQNSL